MENKIEILDLQKNYKTFSLKNLSFCVPKGYITGFIGPNGSGKTTTIKSILSMINIDGGKIIYDEKVITDDDKKYLTEVGVVIDSPFICKDWNMKDLNKAMNLGYENWEENKYFSYLKNFNIDTNLKVKELSKGMYVKMMVAVALSHNAKTLILDEPTSGLDPSAREELTDILQDFVKDEENTVLFSTHITEDLEEVADFIIFIMDGRKIFFGSKDEFLEEFLIVKGGLEELKEIDEKILIGTKKYETGFESMIKVKDYSKIKGNLLTEKTTIDKIMKFYNRGEK